MKQFDVPIVLFMFKRMKAVDVIRRIKKVQPQKLYLLSDEGRSPEEKKLVKKCREAVEKEIDWPCEIIKNYAQKNKGVYENIGEGSKWVLQREKWAIFLEDDNLPEITFFKFCKEMLHMYEDDTRILWICGTNYLGKYDSPNKESYVFTRHMLPCGWASWGKKFCRFYDGKLMLCNNKNIVDSIEKNYYSRALYLQYKDRWMSEYYKIIRKETPRSWDYQMDFAIKANNLLGICPCNNQIKNIGVDEDSIHGGNSFSNEMTKRFCSMNSYSIDFPLIHPEVVYEDKVFEKKIAQVMLMPLKNRIKASFSRAIRKILRVPEGLRIREWVFRKND